ncbi:MAG TPA: MATE family efflux transporter [Ruminiclostridium sp.]|nr:MATE family efflux transporter [Ruminiclostridium sp.]
MDNTRRLGEENILKLLMEFSIPSIVGMLVSALYNVVDRIFIGNSSGPLGLAGITIGFPIMIIQMAFGGLIGLGATAMVSIRLGQKKKEEAEVIMGNAVILLGVISVIVTAVGLMFMDPILRVFGASDQVLPYARDYMSIILAGSIFGSTSFGMNNFMRAEGKPAISMLTMIIGVVLNVLLAPLFIFVFGWGMKGAALATIISQAVSATWIMSHFIMGKSTLKIKKENMRLRPEIVKGIFSIGIAPFSMQVAQCALSAILNLRLGAYGGDIAISGMGVVNSLMTLVVMPVLGLNQGAQPIIGYNYGAENYHRVKKVLKSAAIGGTIITTSGFIITHLFPTQLVSFFSGDKELISFGSHAIVWFLMLFPVVGFQIIGSGYFQAVGKPVKSMVLSLSRQVLVLIPALLILPNFFGMNGILAAGPLSDLISFIVTGIWLSIELKYLNRRQLQKKEPEPVILNNTPIKES